MTLTAQNPTTTAAQQKTQMLLADLWRRNRPVIEDRLAALDRAAQAAASDPMPEDLRLAALDVAHKLSGSLGMFGFDQGTAIARELEHLLGTPPPDSQRLSHLTGQLREMLLPSS